MTARSIGYWITTGLFALALGASGAFNLLQAPPVVEGLARLGYPAYLATILGAWKLLGVIAIATPGMPRLKEWAYAGFFFQLTGAMISHLVSGDPQIGVPVVLLALGVASWGLRPATRVLGTVLPERRSSPGLAPAVTAAP